MHHSPADSAGGWRPLVPHSEQPSAEDATSVRLQPEWRRGGWQRPIGSGGLGSESGGGYPCVRQHQQGGPNAAPAAAATGVGDMAANLESMSAGIREGRQPKAPAASGVTWRQQAAAAAAPAVASAAAPPPRMAARQHLGAWVPVKQWRTCAEVADNMCALPAARLDQKLLSATMQQMVTAHGRAPGTGDMACFRRLLDLALPRMPSFDSFGLCILVRTAARLKVTLTAAEMAAWCRTAEQQLDSFNPQDLANSLFSVGVMDQRLLTAVLGPFGAAVERLCWTMKPQEQSNTLLGLSYMHGERLRNTPPPAPVEAAAVAVLRAAVQHLPDFSNQELANLAWAFSKITCAPGWRRCLDEMRELFVEAGSRVPHLPPQELSNLVLAQANVTFFHPRALSGLVAAAAANARRLDEQHIANVLKSVATLPHQHAELPPAGHPQQQAQWRGSAASQDNHAPESLAAADVAATSAVAGADVAALQEELLRRLSSAEQQRRPGYTPTATGICHSVWALAMLQACTPEVWRAALQALAAWEQAGFLDLDEGHMQLYHAQLLLAAEQPQWQLRLPPHMQQRGRRAWRQSLEGSRGSALQRQVAAALRAAGVQHEEEFSTQDGEHSIDLALPQERIAIEVDGPHHFSVNCAGGRHWPLGRTSARNRLLAALGWRVLQVDGCAWQRLPAGSEGEWLRTQLEAAMQAPACRGPAVTPAQPQ